MLCVFMLVWILFILFLMVGVELLCCFWCMVRLGLVGGFVGWVGGYVISVRRI